MKVFNHDARSGGCFPTRSVDPETKEQKRINEDDPDAGRFSIIDGICFLHCGGWLEFVLMYRGLELGLRHCLKMSFLRSRYRLR